jgi:hypothetical protein
MRQTAKAAQEERQMTMPLECRGARIAACLLLASLAPCCADPAPVIYYAPAENLEHVDVELIDRAQHEIDRRRVGLCRYVMLERSIFIAAVTSRASRMRCSLI